MAAQSGNEGLRLPVPERSIVGKATSFGRPSGAFCQARIRGGLVDKDEPRQGFVEEPLSTVDPQVTRLGDLKPALLACLGAFLLLSPSRCRNRPTVARWTSMPRSANATHSSSKVVTLRTDIRSRTQSP